MQYSDISFHNEFRGNLRQTSWSSLFPYWYMEDDFLKTIGEEIELIKAQGVFRLLNIGVKPPVMLWQTSLNHKEYNINKTITTLDNPIQIQAPFYKTWGTIQIINNGNELSNLEIMFNNNDGILMPFVIPQNADILLDLENQLFYVNNKKVDVLIRGEGLPYFITSQNNEKYQKDTPLHNEIVNLFLSSNTQDVNLDVNISLKNVVFENEQNIEVTSLEALPLEKVILYAYYDFPYNSIINGWKKVYEKIYEEDTHVVYDMITTRFYTKQFYVEVWFKNVDYPYTIGFPAYKDADESSIYHINSELDTLGELLSLPRRIYKTNISEEDYPFTFPIFYPFDIEQDFWYYSRLVNEYCYNDLAIDTVDIVDTDNTPVVRLHSINPFVEDFVVYSHSSAPSERENIDYHEYIPSMVSQINDKVTHANHHNIENLLKYDDSYTYNTLSTKSGNAISYETYQSKPLMMWFNTSNLPSDVNITGIEIILDAESTDNAFTKYNDDRTSIFITPNTLNGQIQSSGHFELTRKNIVYGGKNELFNLEYIPTNNLHVTQKIIIKPFVGNTTEYMIIPFTYYEDDEIIDDISDVFISFYNDKNECIGSSQGYYYKDLSENKTIRRYIKVEVPQLTELTKINITSTTDEYHPFSININAQMAEITALTTAQGQRYRQLEGLIAEKTNALNANISNEERIVLEEELELLQEEFNQLHTQEERYLAFDEDAGIMPIEGPLDDDNKINTLKITKEWDTGDLRDLLNEYGLYFNYALTNDSTNSTSTVLLHNATLRIYHTPKESHFKLSTNITKISKLNNTAELEVRITNNGEKSLNTHIDIIHASNLKLSDNHIDVNLNSGDSMTKVINVKAEYGIQDGIYDIVTICEDQTKINYVKIVSDGLIRTNVKLKPHFCKIDEEITLKANVHTISNDTINGSPNKIEFYINNFYVGAGIVYQNQAECTIRPSDYSFINAGNFKLTAKFIDGSKYTTSYTNSNIFIDKNNITVNLEANDTAIQHQSYHINTNVTYINNGVVQPVEDGTITVFINDNEIFTRELINGVLDTSFNIEEKAGNATLTVRYNNTDKYPQSEITKDILIIGGDTKVTVFDVNGKPGDEVIIKSKVTDSNNTIVSDGYFDYEIIISENNENNVNIVNQQIHNGMDEIKFLIPTDILTNDNDIKILDVKVTYHYNENIESESLFGNSKGIGKIYIKKGEVIIQDSLLFNASAYEPLGFYVKIIDVSTMQPISQGQVTITIPQQNISFSAQVDEDGGARLIYNPIQFTADEWNELERTRFIICDSDPNALDINGEPVYTEEHPYEIYYAENSDLYYLYDYSEEDEPTCELLHRIGRSDEINLINFYISDGILYYQSENDEHVEHVYIDENGILYARSANDSLRQYSDGLFEIIIDYNSEYQYKHQYKESNINISIPNIDVDMHSYNISYNKPMSIKSYVTEYSWDNDTTTTWIQDGQLNYYIDGVFLETVNIINGLATLPSTSVYKIPNGKHLLTAHLLNDIPTYTHVLINIEQATATMNYNLNRKFSNKKSILTVDIDIENFEITGDLSVLIDDREVGYTLFTGEENGEAEFIIDMPDLTDETHILKIQYSGNNYIKPCSIEEILKPEQLEVTTICEDNITTTAQNTCEISVKVTSDDHDDISEGYVALYNPENNQEIARAFIVNNHGTLVFTAPEEYGHYQYTIKYQNGVNYKDDITSIININVIEGYDTVYADGNTDPNNLEHYINLIAAIRAVKDGGTVYLTNEENNTGLLTNDYKFTKDVTIIGTNNAKITKDITNLINDFNDVKSYDKEQFDNEEFNTLYKIDFLSTSNLNTNEYRLIDKDIYYINNGKLVPVYIIDGEFYSTLNIHKKHTTIYTNGHNITFENIVFENDDIENDLLIYNNGNLRIIYSIINNNISIENHNTLTINRSLVYGNIKLLSQDVDLNNNWWGTNTPPFNVDNHIILTISTLDTPPIISESINIQLQLIGANGREYLLPSPYFKIYADSGIIANEYGKLSNSKIITKYDDAIKEGKVYGEIDNQIVSLDVYDYDRKTEVILDSINKVPRGYQITLKAIVQSVADTFFKFDDNDNIINQSNNINNGYVIFSLDGQKIGKAYVQDGIALLPTYLSENVYELGNMTLEAKYIPSEYYFSSQNNKTIQIINDIDYCFVSPNGNDNNTGIFSEPVQTITKAITLNKPYILLQQGVYNDNNIIINNEVHIEAYDDNVFINNSFINNNILYLKDITFANNNNIIIDNAGELYVDNCIFKDNADYLINNDNSIVTSICNSIILDTQIVTDYSKLDNMEYCWFGTNTPNDKIDLTNENYTINQYYIMDIDASKKDATTSENIIYLGSIVLIKARLQYIYDNGNIIYADDKTLPLRIAYFETDAGSLMPIKDYTHNKQAITLLNTNDNTNTDKVIITTPNNINYVHQPLKLEAYINQSNGTIINDGTLLLTINDGNKNIIQDQKLNINNGLAIYTDDTLNLQCGIYNAIYTYHGTDATCKAEYTFDVKENEIIFNNIYIDDYDHLYELTFMADVVDTLNNVIEYQEVYCYIDNNIAINKDTGYNKFKIINGQAFFNMKYQDISSGMHTLKITNENCSSNYETFTFETKFTSYEKETIIHFNYTGIEKNTPTNLMISVTDNNNKIIDGFISVYINDEIVEIDNKTNFQLSNGTYTLHDVVLEQGQYSIVIYYHGIADYYQESIYIKNDFNVGMYAIHISQDNDITTNIGEEYIFDFDVLDFFDNPVKVGFITIYINEIPINEPFDLSENYHINYPFMISDLFAGEHKITIEYTDNTNTYLDTNIFLNMIINKIPTIISINQIEAYPNSKINVDYNVNFAYNENVNTGILTAKLDGKIIGRTQVSDVINHYIVLDIPLKPTDVYELIFEYEDDNNIYDNCNAIVPLVINRGNVNISTSHDSYYPNREFMFDIDVTDDNGDLINNGFISLYIDNVRETEPIEVKYGQVRYPLTLQQIRDYPVTIIYEENEYYQETKYLQVITVNNIQIKDITINEELTSLPNETHNYHLEFNTMDNYNIDDGIIDFIFDGELLHSYHIQESNKEFNITIPNTYTGNHILELFYHDSNIFKNYRKEFVFTITEKTLTLTMEDIEVSLTNEIDIPLSLSEITNGLIKFYIGDVRVVNDNEYEFIDNNLRYAGIEQITEQNIIHSYQLSQTMYNNKYYIKAVFEGNNQYGYSEATCLLTIIPQETNLFINSDTYTDDESHTPIIETSYQGTISIDVSSNILNNEPIYIYINNQYIGESLLDDMPYEYPLPKKYTEGEYEIQVQYLGNPVIQSKTAYAILRVNKFKPIIKTLTYTPYIGGQLILDNILLDNVGQPITTGDLQCIFNDEEIQVYPNKPKVIDLDPTIINTTAIISYIPIGNKTFEPIIDAEININAQKNNLEINMHTIPEVYRDEIFDVKFTLTSDTTSMPININNANINNEPITIEEGLCETQLTIDSSEDYSKQYAFTITIPESDAFEEYEHTFNIMCKNYNEVYLDYNAESCNAQLANNIEKALDLVADNGTIYLLSNIENEDINIDKRIHIIGQNQNDMYTILNSSINADSALNIQNIIFDNSSVISSAYTNIDNCIFINNEDNALNVQDGELYVSNCCFKDNYATNGAGIYVSNKNKNTEITYCRFINNEAVNYGGAIYSDKGNNILINHCVFTQNKALHGASININGDAVISENSFYDNYQCAGSEISVFSGVIECMLNLFDGKICAFRSNGYITANMCYWGRNDILTIENILNDLNEQIIIDSWLIEENDVINQYMTKDIPDIKTTIDEISYQFEFYRA